MAFGDPSGPALRLAALVSLLCRLPVGASVQQQGLRRPTPSGAASGDAVNRRDLFKTATASGAVLTALGGALPLVAPPPLLRRPALGAGGGGEADLNPVARASAVFCDGPLLDAVQRAGVFGDCKIFVDSPLKCSPEEVLRRFAAMPPDATPKQLRAFVAAHFDRPGADLVRWDPPDARPEPPALARIKDDELREWGYSLNAFWGQLGRATSREAAETPERRTLIALPHPFIVPGGRFVETYYWDNYWILKGLLVCGMRETAAGMIRNMLHQLDAFGFVPNGGRIYYLDRSQPPTLSESVAAYLTDDFDLRLLREALPRLEAEYAFWMQAGEGGHAVDVELLSGGRARLNRYVAGGGGPRPESYLQDIATAAHPSVGDSAAERRRVYAEIAAAAESGWDFSSRWLEDGVSLHTARTSEILPVDLNSIMYRFERNLQQLSLMAGDGAAAATYARAAEARRRAMDELMWSPSRRQWVDFHWPSHTPHDADATSASNWLPLWAGAHDQRQARLAVQSLRHSRILQTGGVAATTSRDTGHQWDWPNAWAPLQEMIIEGLERTGREDASELALEIARRWSTSNWRAWRKTHYMYEKYSAVELGVGGGGGEYTPQVGFGWTNGVALSLLARYGDRLVE